MTSATSFLRQVYIPQSELSPLINPSGSQSYHLWQMFPWTSSFITEYEKNYDTRPIFSYVNERMYLPVYTVIIYMAAIYFGQKYMRTCKPFDLRVPLAYWNLMLSLFSLIGMIRTLPYLFYYSTHMSFKEINCTDPEITHGERDIGLWVMLFAASKFFELFDTMFIVLRKKPLIFLHWYHHVTVLLYTYYSSASNHAGLYFVCMNYTVHTFMYGYFFLMAKKSVPKWFNPLWITIMQISQMIFGVFIVGSMGYYKFIDSDGCEGAREPLLYASFVMYGSYLYLFVEFAVKRFIFGVNKKVSSSKSNDASMEKKSLSDNSTEKPPSFKRKISFVRQNSAYDIALQEEIDFDSNDSNTDDSSEGEGANEYLKKHQ